MKPLRVCRVTFEDGQQVCMSVRDQSDVAEFCSAWTDKRVIQIEMVVESLS